jgi:hypothetical protein
MVLLWKHGLSEADQFPPGFRISLFLNPKPTLNQSGMILRGFEYGRRLSNGLLSPLCLSRREHYDG